MANVNGKKKVLGISAAALGVCVLTVGSFALFSDSAAIKGTTRAGKLAVGITADKMTDAGDFSEQLLNTEFEDEVHNLNPGDVRVIAYSINNDEDKAMRANDTITVTIKPDAAMMADQNKTVQDLYAEYTTDKSAIHLVQGTKGVDAEVITSTDPNAADYKTTVSFPDTGITLKDSYINEDGAIVLVYQGDEVNLDGTGTTNVEKIPGNGGKTSSDREYTLYFEETAGNAWQNADLSVSSKVSALQYANTVAGDATLNIDTDNHTVATAAGGDHSVEIAKEGVKTDEAGKTVAQD